MTVKELKEKLDYCSEDFEIKIDVGRHQDRSLLTSFCVTHNSDGGCEVLLTPKFFDHE